MLAIIFFSLVYGISPITAYADSDASQDQNVSAEQITEQAVVETINTDASAPAPEETIDIVVPSTPVVEEQATTTVAQSAVAIATSTPVDETPKCDVNGLYGTYYNLPKNHPNIETDITGVVPGTTPFQYDWFSDQYLVFKRNDLISSLNVPHDYFPVNTGLEGDPFYFAVHWQGSVITPSAGLYEARLAADDDAWLYINGVKKIDIGGIHPLTASSTVLDLPAGTSTIDIYFAERHTVQSGIQFSIDGGVTFSPCQAPANLPPEFVNFAPPVVATSTEVYSYNVTATDPDNDPLAFVLLAHPDGMTIATSTGAISWTPTRAQATSTPYVVTVQVSDPTHSIERSFLIVVSLPQNRLPVFTGPEIASGTTGNAITFTINVTDPDGDTITQTQEFPEGATFASSTFSWVPASAGTYAAKFFAFDGTGTTTYEVAITVSTQSTGSGGGGIVPTSQTISTGGGGIIANGQLIPLLPPTSISHTTATTTVPHTQPSPTNIPTVTKVPLQSTPITIHAAPAPVLKAKEPGATKGVSIISTTTPATTSAAAGGRSIASYLLAGLFNVANWFGLHWRVLGWLLFIIALIMFILYVIFSEEDEKINTEKTDIPPSIAEPQTVPEGMMFEDSEPEPAVSEYWETYKQEKE
jgi:fibro-slime domain-containing protein